MPRELFRFDAAGSVADFSPIDDRVMGGRSASRLRHDPAGHAVFEGEVSLADGGGFASVRSRPLPLGDAQAVTLSHRGARRRQALQAQPAHRRPFRRRDIPSAVRASVGRMDRAASATGVVRADLARPPGRGRARVAAGEPAPAGPRDCRTSGRERLRWRCVRSHWSDPACPRPSEILVNGCDSA